MRRWEEGGSDRDTVVGMDMNFVFKCMCLITYVSSLLNVIDCGNTGMGGRWVLVAPATPKKT